MNFDQLKQLAEKLGGVLVMDGDKPKFVIVSYDQYRRTENQEPATVSESFKSIEPEASMIDVENQDKSEEDQRNYDRLNQEILALREEIKRKESAELIGNVEAEEGVVPDIVDFE